MIVLALSGGHIIILVAALLLFFGGSKIPELMGGLGKGMKDFKKAIKDDDDTSAITPKDDSSVPSTKVTPAAGNKNEPLKE